MTPASRVPSSSALASSRRALPAYVEALLHPDAYDHPADDLRLHETHISWVILAGPFAYKVKKPVDFGFLDYSTVAHRAKACADEVRLNRRLAPDVYLGVRTLVERDGRYFVGSAGRPIEPVVWMRRLPEEGMLTRLLARDAADVSLMRRIANQLARFHAAAATGPGVDQYGSPDVLRANWEENFAQTEWCVGVTLAVEIRQSVQRYVRAFLEDQSELLLRRVREGRIRDGHGDLHAASICLDDSRLVFFDCIEFSPRYRCADVVADMAFLAMDLDHFGRGDLAEAFVSAYIRASGDQEVRRLLPIYQCYRAYVRGKVQSLRLTEPALSEADRSRAIAEARAYFDLAWAYAGGLPRPALVVVMGLPGSGRTGLADRLARHLGLVRLTADAVRRELAGRRPAASSPASPEPELDGPEQSQRTYALLRRRAARWLRRGRSVIVEASFGQREQRAAIRRLARRLDVPAIFLHCRAPAPPQRQHLAEGRGLSQWRPADLSTLEARFDPPTEMGDVIEVEPTEAVDEALPTVLSMLRQRLGRLDAGRAL